MKKFDIAIIGGGASGLAAAISARKHGAERVAILERQPRVGKKLLATGNGRCNILNEYASYDAFFGSKPLARAVLSRFSYEALSAFFRESGLEIHASPEGLAYPVSNQASAVLDCLRLSVAELGISEITEFDCKAIQKEAGIFKLSSSGGDMVSARRVIVSCGGMAQPKLGGGSFLKQLMEPVGHTFMPCLPALSPIKTNPSDVQGLKGQKYQGEIALSDEKSEIARETGEILFTENGVSGIACMQLTLHIAPMLQKGKNAYIILSPLSLCIDDAIKMLKERKNALSTRALEDYLTGLLPKRIGQFILKNAGVHPLSRPVQSLTDKEIANIAHQATAWRIGVTGIGGFDVCQVMLGGAKAEEFDFSTLESRKMPGMYAAGELLDVTGPCGGYNLTWAWASGILAGRSAAESL